MLIDKVRKIARLALKRNHHNDKAAEDIALLDQSTAYEVSALCAFLERLVDKDKFPDFAEHVLTLDNSAAFRFPMWIERRGINAGFVITADGTVTQYFLEGDTVDVSPLAATDPEFADRGHNYLSFLLSVIGFVQGQEIPQIREVVAQEHKPAKTKNGKEVKGPLHRVLTIVIDGVVWTYNQEKKSHEYVVEHQGWHVRLHDVIGHWRHLDNGKEYCTCHSPSKPATWISPFTKGNSMLGKVQPETRYKVAPFERREEIR